MLRIAWNRAKKFKLRRKLNQTGECFVTIYSRKLVVVDSVVDSYLSSKDSFSQLHNARIREQHEVFVSHSLAEATERLIQLRKAGRVSSHHGSACHLVATVNVHFMEQLVRKSKDFRPYLRELSMATPKKVVNM